MAYRDGGIAELLRERPRDVYAVRMDGRNAESSGMRRSSGAHGQIVRDLAGHHANDLGSVRRKFNLVTCYGLDSCVVLFARLKVANHVGIRVEIGAIDLAVVFIVQVNPLKQQKLVSC